MFRNDAQCFVKEVKMLKKRTLALLLSLAMLLTFMPAMAFADNEEAGADQQVTEAAEEAVEATEAAEEVSETAEEAVEAEDQAVELAAATPVKGVFHCKDELWGYAGDSSIEHNLFERSMDNTPNSIDVTFSDGKVVTYIFNSEEWGYFPDGDASKGEANFRLDEVRFKEGTNTIGLYMDIDEESYKIGTVNVTGVKAKVDKFVYTQADPLEAELDDEGWANYYSRMDYLEPFAGDTIHLKAYDYVEVHDENDNVSVKYEPYEAVYKCQLKCFEGDREKSYQFWLEKTISGEEWASPMIEVVFWDDQDKAQWKAGSTHEITVTYQGVEAEGKLVVNVAGNAAPHEHVAGTVKQVAITEATCTKGGTYVDVTYCKECGEEMSRSTPKASKPLGHSIHKMAAKAATCQETGVKAHYECSNCGGMFKDAKGKKTTTVKKLIVKKKKHNYKEKKIDAEHLKSAATCTKPAVYYYSCKMCHEKGKKTFKSGKALGHKFEQAVTKATPTKNGSIGQKCTVCGKKGKTKAIPKASKIAVVKKYKKKGVPASALAGGAFIEVKNAKGKKIPASEYDIAFNNNEEAGTGSATITFKGANYEGTKTVTYKIQK